MDFNGLTKELKIFFRNKTVVLTILFMLVLEASILARSLTVITEESLSPLFSFRFLQQHLMLMFFPAILTNILIIAFSVTAERQSGMISRLVPGGVSAMMRNKSAVCALISSGLSFLYIISAIFISGLNFYLNYRFVLFLTASYLFILTGLSAFSVSFAFRYNNGTADYEPDLKGMLIFMLTVTFSVVAFYFFLSVNMRFYYEFVAGFRFSYPNLEFILFLVSTFLFLILGRLMLNSAQKKLSGEQY
jgi:hypothetical protein